MNPLFRCIFFLLFFILLNKNTGHLIANNHQPIEKHPSVKQVKSYHTGDSILQIHSYSFTTPGFDLFNPIAELTESGEMALLTRSGLYFFNGKTLRSIPSQSRISSSAFNNIFVSQDHWLWMVDRSRELMRPITNTAFYNYKTNTFLSGDDFFKGTVLEGKRLVNIASLNRKKLVINTYDGEIFIYEQGQIRALHLENENLLIGKGPNFEIITREKTRDGFLITIIDLKNDSIRKLPEIKTPDEIIHSFIKDGYVYALFGFDGQDGLFIYPIKGEDGEKDWYFNDNILGFHSYGSQFGSHYFGYLDVSQIHEVQGYDLIRSDRAELLHEILSPGTPLKKLTTAFGEWRYNRNGLHFLWKSPNKMNGLAGNNFLPGVSTRKLKFKGDSILSAATYSGFYEMDLTSFPEKSVEFIRDPGLLDCQKYYCLNFFFKNDQKLILAGEEVVVFDFENKSCDEFLAPDGHKIEIWGFENIAPNQFILGSVNGPLFLSRSKEEMYKISRLHYSNGYEHYNEVGINRIKRKNQSDTLMICTNAGLILAKWEGTDEHNIQVLEVVKPNEVIYDATFYNHNSLFLATHHSGLLWLTPYEDFNTIYEYNRSNFFAFNTAHNIQTDIQDRLWVGTNHGLYIINPKKRQIRQLNTTDGFVNDEFNRLSSAKSPSGLFAFGGIDGASVFDPNAFKIIEKENNLALNKIILYDHRGKRTYIYPRLQDTHIEIQTAKNTEEAVFVFNGGLLQKQANLFVRKAGKNGFWVPLKEGKISIREIENSNEVYELKAILPDGSTVIHSASFIIINHKSYQSYIWVMAFILLLAIYSIYRNWRTVSSSNSDEKTIETEKDEGTQNAVDEVIENKKHMTDPTDPLHEFLREFDRKEQALLLHTHQQTDPFVTTLNEVVMDYLDSNDFSVELIAKKINLSTRQLHRKVVDHTGLTPNKYFTFIRLKKSRELICKKPNISITEVAYQTGFQKPSYFSKLFKELYDISPKKYQKKFLNLVQNQNSGGV